MKVEYLGDGSLDRHGVDPGDRGIPSVLQAGSCKRGRIFFTHHLYDRLSASLFLRLVEKGIYLGRWPRKMRPQRKHVCRVNVGEGKQELQELVGDALK